MSGPLVIRTDSGGVSTLTLNRPEKLNALNPSLFVEFRQHVDAIANDESIGCVIVFVPDMTSVRFHQMSMLPLSILSQRLSMPLNNFRNRRLRRFEVIALRVDLNSLWHAIY